MYWLYLPLALGCFVYAFKTTSMGVLALCLLAALALLIGWVRGLYIARFQGLESDDRAFLQAHLRNAPTSPRIEPRAAALDDSAPTPPPTERPHSS